VAFCAQSGCDFGKSASQFINSGYRWSDKAALALQAGLAKNQRQQNQQNIMQQQGF
jgi:hypothetical protein